MTTTPGLVGSLPADEGGRLASARSLGQVNKWWTSKLGPLLATALMALLVEDRPLREAAALLVLLVWTTVLLASAAYVVNDWFDRDVDRAAGKTSVAMRMGPRTVVLILAVLVVAGVAPWLLTEIPFVAWVALGAVVVVPYLYSAPPLRWKERGGLGLLADAVLAHVAPTTFALATFGVFDRLDEPAVLLTAIGTVTWSFVAGMRRIIGHELVDLVSDREAGVVTWVDRVGEKRARTVGTRVVMPLEVVSLAVALVGLAFVVPLVAATFVVIALSMGYARLIGAWDAPLPALPTSTDERTVLYLFLRFWPGLVFAVALAVRDPVYVLVLVAYLVLFWSVALDELSGLAIAGGEAIRLTWSTVANWLRYRVWEGVVHGVPNGLRHRLWPWLSALAFTVWSWFRHRLWPWLTSTIPNWFRYRLWTALVHGIPNWVRHRAWVWISHTAPNWFRYRLPGLARRLMARLKAWARR